MTGEDIQWGKKARVQQQIAEGKARWDRLSEQLEEVQRARDYETNPLTKLALSKDWT
jgi:hypothetical protein